MYPKARQALYRGDMAGGSPPDGAGGTRRGRTAPAAVLAVGAGSCGGYPAQGNCILLCSARLWQRATRAEPGQERREVVWV